VIYIVIFSLIGKGFDIKDYFETEIDSIDFINLNGSIQGVNGLNYKIDLDQKTIVFSYEKRNIPYVLVLIESIVYDEFTPNKNSKLTSNLKEYSFTPKDTRLGTDFILKCYEIMENSTEVRLELENSPIDWAYSVTYILHPDHHDDYFKDLFLKKNKK